MISRERMIAYITAGGSVLYHGRIISRVEDLPAEVEAEAPAAEVEAEAPAAEVVEEAPAAEVVEEETTTAKRRTRT